MRLQRCLICQYGSSVCKVTLVYLEQFVHQGPNCCVEDVFLGGMLVVDEVEIEMAELRQRSTFAFGMVCPKRDVSATTYLTPDIGHLEGAFLER